MTKQTMFMAVAVLTGFSTVGAAQSSSLDYPQWRGANRDGAAAGFAEPKSWPETLTLKWKIEVGPGYSTPILIGNRVYTHVRRDENEVMMALDAATGKVLWQMILGGIIQESTITYSVNGKQYVGVLTGDSTSGTTGLLSQVPDLKPPRGHNEIYVFALP